jgi:hypothetical protein
LGGALHAQTVQGNLLNQGGALAPGNSAGTTAITGHYTQQSGAQLDIEIGGLIGGADFDQVTVAGNATLGGTLDVSLINSFAPTPGQMFTVLTADSVVYDGLALGGPAANLFYLLIGPTHVALQAAGLPGDFNFDGAVDAGDYVVLRKSTGYLPSYYDLWRANIGAPGSGAGVAGGAVPEPAAGLLLACGLLPLAWRRKSVRTDPCRT